MYTVCRYPSALLRRVAEPITAEEFSSPELFEFAEALCETMMEFGGLIGLAATQVEETTRKDGKPWRCFAISLGDGSSMVLCNPTIVETGPEELGMEGCASFANVQELVKAPSSVVICAQDIEGNAIGHRGRIPLGGLEARCAFHETGHLQGQVISDRMSLMKRKMFLKKVEKTYRRIG